MAPEGPRGLVDQHAHPLTGGDPGLGVFERHLAAAATGGAAVGGTWFDSHLGLAVLRWCPPPLGLAPHCAPVAYLARRRALGPHAVRRRLRAASGVAEQLLASPPRSVPSAEPVAHGWAATPHQDPAPEPGAGELTVLGPLVHQVAVTSGDPRVFLRHVTEAVHQAADRTAAFVCDTGPLLHAAPGPGLPAAGALRRAAERQLWAVGREPGRRPGPGVRAAEPSPPDPVLLHHLLREALATGRPVQLRCGDPAPLAGLLRSTAGRGRVVLLPDRPYHRRAARLAAVFPHVYADAGPDPARTLAEAPFGKLLYTSRAGVLPELRLVRARLFHRDLARLLDRWVADGDCPAPVARRVAERIGGGTARRLYALPD